MLLLYGFEIWSLKVNTRRKRACVRVCVCVCVWKQTLKEMCRATKEEVTGKCQQLRTEKVCYL